MADKGQKKKKRAPATGNTLRAHWRKEKPDHLRAVFDDCPEFDDTFVDTMIAESGGNAIRRGAVRRNDTATPHRNIVDGVRRTTDTPDRWENTIYLLGSSFALCTYDPDRLTIASHLQRLCNALLPGRYRVENHGVGGVPAVNSFLMLERLALRPGDMVLLLENRLLNEDDARRSQSVVYALQMNADARERGARFVYLHYPRPEAIRRPTPHERRVAYFDYDDLCRNRRGTFRYRPPRRYVEPPVLETLRAAGCACADLQPYFERPHLLGEVFLDKTHVCNRGNRRVADVFYREFVAPGNDARFAAPVMAPENGRARCREGGARFLRFTARRYYGRNASIRAWLKEARNPAFAEGARLGAIVMNANPFTRGHLHLVEYALERVEGLYLFVVEEDRSAFPFAERIALIREGVAHLGGRVHVAGSGQFIISSFSFPEYFEKETKEVEIDATADLAIFGGVIAPALGIRRRFVGEEPLCPVTRQYNDAMLALLPGMEVEVEVIARRAGGADGEPISASRVRRLLAAGDFAALGELVPEATLRYLTARAGGAAGQSA